MRQRISRLETKFSLGKDRYTALQYMQYIDKDTAALNILAGTGELTTAWKHASAMSGRPPRDMSQ